MIVSFLKDQNLTLCTKSDSNMYVHRQSCCKSRCLIKCYGKPLGCKNKILSNHKIPWNSNIPYLFSSVAKSTLLLARAKMRTLQLDQFERCDKMWERRTVKPPSSYNHHTSIVPLLFLAWNTFMASRVSLGTVDPFAVK